MSVATLGKAGRPYIGPKAQTHIWPDIHEYVKAEASARGISHADVYREMLEEAYALRVEGEA